MLYSMKWHRQLTRAALSCVLFCAPLNAWAQESQSDSIQLSTQEKIELVQLENRRGESLRDRKRDPARAFLLSTLYPGLGQLYVGNDNQRSLWVMGAGSALLAGGVLGYALLADRPPEASDLGNILITSVLLGYWLWNIRDAYVQADEYNSYLERQDLNTMLQHLRLAYRQDTLMVGVQFSL